MSKLGRGDCRFKTKQEALEQMKESLKKYGMSLQASERLIKEV